MTTNIEDLSGEWSSDWGNVTLTVSESKVSGTWEKGTITGEVKDATLNVSWTHSAGTKGKAILTPNDGRDELAGTWGFDDEAAGEGNWSLKQVKRNAPAPAEPKKPEAPKKDAPAEPPAAEAPAPAKEEPKAKAKAKKGTK